MNEKILLSLSSIIQIPIFRTECCDTTKIVGSNFVLNDTIFIFGKTVKLKWLDDINYIL